MKEEHHLLILLTTPPFSVPKFANEPQTKLQIFQKTNEKNTKKCTTQKYHTINEYDEQDKNNNDDGESEM